MPPKRRSAGAAAQTPSSRTQATLSFNNKSRVTKQSNILPPSSDKKSTTKRLSDQAKAEIIDQVSDFEKPVIEEIKIHDSAVEQRQEQEEEKVDEKEESTPVAPRRKPQKVQTSSYDGHAKEASKITDAKIKSYWKAEEDSRLAPRVHQNDIHIHEKILRHFDLSSQYGPCIGTPRLERWKRASRLGMDPPIEVLAVLLREEKKGTDKGFGGRQCGQLAYIDELAGGRVVLVE